MKEATGELNMTVITVVAIAAIAGIFAFILPTLKEKITNSVDKSDACPEGYKMNDNNQCVQEQ